MSADNLIRINKNHKGKWVVRECWAENGATIRKLSFEKSLEDAIRAANAFMEENEVEYGLQIEL